MNMQKYKQIEKAFIADLEAVFKKYDLKVSSFRASIGTGTVDLKVALTSTDMTDANGKKTTAEAEAFKRMAGILGMKPSDLGRDVCAGSKTYTLVGYNPRKRTKCMLLEHGGKTYIATPDQVIAGMLLAERKKTAA